MNALTEFALNELGAEYDGAALSFTDSFGALILQAHKKVWYTQDAQAVNSKVRLRDLLRRGGGVNAAGITKGTVLTPLGVTPFSLRYYCEKGFKPSSLGVQLLYERPFHFGGVIYEQVSCNHYEYGGFRRVGGRWARRLDSKAAGYDLSPALAQFLYALEGQAARALFTPESRAAAQLAEAQMRLESVRAEIKKLQARENDILSEIAALSPPFANDR